MEILNLAQIKERLDLHKAIQLQEEGFVLYSQGKVTVPPVGHLDFGSDKGILHIKYGYIGNDSVYVVKVASAFYQNSSQFNISTVQGLILVFDASTGQPRIILQDEGYLTQLRTAIAGLITAKYLAPRSIRAIGVIGTGNQARFQTQLLKKLTACRIIWVWGRSHEKAEVYARDMQLEGFEVHIAKKSSEVACHCNLIITTTNAREPILYAEDVLPGTHITALGADSPGKQELDPKIFSRADICVADSTLQCLHHGDINHAVKAGFLKKEKIMELGQVISNPALGRTNNQQLTVADLTGVAVQDIQIAKAIVV